MLVIWAAPFCRTSLSFRFDCDKIYRCFQGGLASEKSLGFVNVNVPSEECCVHCWNGFNKKRNLCVVNLSVVLTV